MQISVKLQILLPECKKVQLFLVRLMKFFGNWEKTFLHLDKYGKICYNVLM